jgi:hypothetical protein
VDQQVIDRRADRRVQFGPTGLGATLRPGCSVRVIDLCEGGALVESGRPLRPGARVHVQVAASARTFSVTARILRCAVWELHPSDGATYRGALQFENRCELVWESSTQCGAEVPGLAKPDTGRNGQGIPEVSGITPMKTRGSAK